MPIDPTRASISDAAQLLSSEFGQPIDQAWIEADIQHGCPLNPDGTLNTIIYCAWLLKEEKR